jgi:hypothetical protein
MACRFIRLKANGRVLGAHVDDLQPALAELGHQPAQGEVLLPAVLNQPARCTPEIFFGLWPPIWPGLRLPARACSGVRQRLRSSRVPHTAPSLGQMWMLWIETNSS